MVRQVLTKQNLPEYNALYFGRWPFQPKAYGWSYSASMRAFGSTFGESATGST